MTNDALIIDTPEGIHAYTILATYHGLKMEIHFTEKYRGMCSPKTLPTRGLALASARRFITAYGLVGPTRTRAQALATLKPLYDQLTKEAAS